MSIYEIVEENDKLKTEICICKTDLEMLEKNIRNLETIIESKNIQLRNLKIIKNDYKLLYSNNFNIIIRISVLYTILIIYLVLSITFNEKSLLLNITVICCAYTFILWSIFDHKYHLKIYEMKLKYNETITFN